MRHVGPTENNCQFKNFPPLYITTVLYVQNSGSHFAFHNLLRSTSQTIYNTMSNPRDSSKQSTPPQSPPPSQHPPPPHTTEEVPPPTPPSSQQTPAPSPLPATGDAAAEGEKVISTAAQAPPLAEGGREASVAAGASRRIPPRKRYREGDSGAGPSTDPPQEQGQFKCSVCSRVFSKEKGLFGHMRSHRDRSWRGAYPPPVFSREEIDEDMAKVIEALSGRERPEIPDINEPAVEEEAEEPPSTPPPRRRKDGKEINLNKPPSPES